MTRPLAATQIASHTPDLTAAQAITHVRTWTDLKPARQASLVSALNTIIRIHKLPADLVLLTPAILRAGFLADTAASFGLEVTTLRTLQSALRFILRRLDVIDAENGQLSIAWEVRLQPFDPRERAGVVRFARFCSMTQISPDGVIDATIPAFQAWLIDRTLATKPAKLAGTTRRAWNRFAASKPGWPAQRLAPVADPRQYALPLDRFTPAFQADLYAFGQRLQASPLSDLFADLDEEALEQAAQSTSPLKPLRATSAALRMSHARWAASALVASGTAIETINNLTDLVTPLPNAQAIHRFMYNHAGGKPSANGMHVGEVLLMIAKYHAGLAPPQVEKLKAWAKQTRLKYPSMTPKNRKTVDAAMTPKVNQDLLELPAALMEAAYAIRAVSPREAVGLAQRALAVGILTRIPLRLANLIGLRLDQHLVSSHGKTWGYDRLHILADETKNSQEILVRVSPALNELLQQWIQDFRPIIAGPGCAFLFPGWSSGGVGAITPQGMRDAIRQVTGRLVGVKITPHQFRHLAAKRFLEEHPGDYETIRQLLGHRSLATTLRHYAGDEMAVSAERFDDMITARIKHMKGDRTSAARSLKRSRKRGAL